MTEDANDHLQSAELAIIIPTFREAGNVAELTRRLVACLAGLRWEAIFVDDDSNDGTASSVRELSRIHPNVRCIQRIGRRGLSSACVEGMLSTSAPYVAVMDADLQHDEALLPAMLRKLQSDKELDIVVGSRHVDGGSLGEWSEQRASISRWATRLSHLVLPKTLQDPMSGFFMMRRDSFMGAVRKLSSVGFKILVDLFASSPKPLKFAELPYTFRTRHAGESKLDSQVAWDYLMLLADKTVGHLVPVRFLSFALIGGLGVFLHMALLSTFLSLMTLPFKQAQAAATIGAMVFNYTINNAMTYRDRRRRGWRWWTGLLSFSVACSVGAIANVGIASYLFDHQNHWVLSAISGILVGAVWNYAITSVYTWKRA
ncbi:glycosyltransferase family 2 protein [Roseateles sp.]|uniref:glycosyltransferase family 2 protein n=1 Tax=Roseateles sp. TaxID=1971397 RepID=UPI0039ECBDB4